MYSQYELIEILTNISLFIHENWWKVLILGFIFIAGIIQIIKWIIELV